MPWRSSSWPKQTLTEGPGAHWFPLARASWFRRRGWLGALHRLRGASLGRSLAGGVARVELGVGGVEVVGVEPDYRHTVATVVELLDHEVLDLARADVAVGPLPEHPGQREPVTPGG